MTDAQRTEYDHLPVELRLMVIDRLYDKKDVRRMLDADRALYGRLSIAHKSLLRAETDNPFFILCRSCARPLCSLDAVDVHNRYNDILIPFQRMHDARVHHESYCMHECRCVVGKRANYDSQLVRLHTCHAVVSNVYSIATLHVVHYLNWCVVGDGISTPKTRAKLFVLENCLYEPGARESRTVVAAAVRHYWHRQFPPAETAETQRLVAHYLEGASAKKDVDRFHDVRLRRAPLRIPRICMG